MISIKRISHAVVLAAIGSGLLLSCQKPQESDKSDLPDAVVEKLDPLTRENLAQADYQIYKYGRVKAYAVNVTDGLCGSGGCETVIYVEKNGKISKIYDDLAQDLQIIPVYPDSFQFRIERSGVMCGKSSNAQECHWLLNWPTKR